MAAEAFTPLLQDSVNALNEKVSHFRVIAENGFTFSEYVRQRLKAKTPPFTVQVIETAKNVKVASDVRYPALYKSLLVLRDAICLEEELPNYHVATAKTLTELANALPLTEKQLLKISGFGPARVSAFGERFLKIINDYVTENGITPELTLESEAPKKKKEKKEKKEKPTKPEKEPTASVTYRMYLSGKDVASIAKERALAATTIEGHLARYVASGEIPLEQLVSHENIKQINAVLDEAVDQEVLDDDERLQPCSLSSTSVFEDEGEKSSSETSVADDVLSEVVSGEKDDDSIPEMLENAEEEDEIIVSHEDHSTGADESSKFFTNESNEELETDSIGGTKNVFSVLNNCSCFAQYD